MPFGHASVSGFAIIPPPQAKPTHVHDTGATICRIVSNGPDWTSGIAIRKTGFAAPRETSAKHTLGEVGLQYLLRTICASVVVQQLVRSTRSNAGKAEEEGERMRMVFMTSFGRRMRLTDRRAVQVL